jgi:hypothetical protein
MRRLTHLLRLDATPDWWAHRHAPSRAHVLPTTLSPSLPLFPHGAVTTSTTILPLLMEMAVPSILQPPSPPVEALACDSPIPHSRWARGPGSAVRARPRLGSAARPWQGSAVRPRLGCWRAALGAAGGSVQRPRRAAGARPARIPRSPPRGSARCARAPVWPVLRTAPPARLAVLAHGHGARPRPGPLAWRGARHGTGARPAPLARSWRVASPPAQLARLRRRAPCPIPALAVTAVCQSSVSPRDSSCHYCRRCTASSMSLSSSPR